MIDFTKVCGRVNALAMLSLLAACQTTDIAGMSEADYECHIFLPIDWSMHDTEATRRKILEHNAVWEEICA